MRMKRGSNSMRVRRRQSDAKWRASVSSCYDTLKFVIPDSCNLPRRKFSKALILQETAKHIRTLEEAVSTLLTQEAKLLNKSVLWKTGKQWAPATLAHIRKEFEEQQGQLFEQSTQGRRRYSMLADIEEQILHMAVDPSRVTVISRGGGTQNKTSKSGTGKEKGKGKEVRVRRKAKILIKDSTKVYEEPQAHSTPCPKKQRKHSHSTSVHDFENQEIIPVICERVPDADLLPCIAFPPDCKYDMSHDVPLTTPSKLCYHGNEKLFSPVAECGFNTPVYVNPNPHRVDTKPPITSPRFSKVAKQLEFTSEDVQPLRPSCPHDKMSEMTSVFGFTPIKLPPESGTVPLDLSHAQATQATPTIQAPQGLTPAFQRNSYPPQTPKSDGDCLESDDEETKSLLCFETFEMLSDDDGVPEWERTPDKDKLGQTSPVEEEQQKDQCKRRIAFGKGTHRMRKSRERIPKCRKNLEKLYSNPEDVDGKELPVITGVFDKDATGSDFDGYFLFYRQVAEMLQQHMSRTEIASPSVAVTVSQMWNDMSSDDKETLATLAALEGSQDSNSSSGLSDDLQELDVKPLDSSHFIDASKIGIFKRNLQGVPNVPSLPTVSETAQRVLGAVPGSQDVQEVPKSYLPSLDDCVDSMEHSTEEMAIINLAFQDQEGLSHLGFDRTEANQEFTTSIAASNDYSGSETSQIVPDITNIIKRDVLLSSSQSPTAVTAHT